MTTEKYKRLAINGLIIMFLLYLSNLLFSVLCEIILQGTENNNENNTRRGGGGGGGEKATLVQCVADISLCGLVL